MGSSARTPTSGLTDVVLRQATAADLPEVAALERVCYGDPWPASAFASLPDNARVFFAVAPDMRGRGIGRALLDAMLRDAESRGTAQLYLEVRESNQAARQLYATRGFEEVGRRKRYYRSPTEDALILRRTLKPKLS